MTTVGHSKVSAKSDGGDSSLVLPSDWNANHATSETDTSKRLAPDGVGGLAWVSGGWTLLEAHTASSSSSLDFTSFISSTYDTYKIEGVELVLATSTADLRVEIGTGGGPTYDTGNNYEWAFNGYRTDGTGAATDVGSTGIARIFKSISTTAGYGFGTFSLTASGLQSTSLRKTFHGTVEYVTSVPQANYGLWGMQWTTTGTAVTALRFIASSGNITSGTIRIYGVAK